MNFEIPKATTNRFRCTHVARQGLCDYCYQWDKTDSQRIKGVLGELYEKVKKVDKDFYEEREAALEKLPQTINWLTDPEQWYELFRYNHTHMQKLPSGRQNAIWVYGCLESVFLDWQCGFAVLLVRGYGI